MREDDALFETTRADFYLPENTLYLDGNSLGLLSRSAERTLLQIVDQWKTLGIGGWTDGEHPWFFLAERLSEATAPLIGAASTSISITNSTTVNLHQMLATLIQPAEACDRCEILTDSSIFPSDAYALASLQRRCPWIKLAAVSPQNNLLQEREIADLITERTLLVLLPSVVYTTGQLLNIAELTVTAHKQGALIGFDCSHSIGSVPHHLEQTGVDFAFWCGYKYLNGGPGATAGLYLHPRHHGKQPGLAGWFGSCKQKQMDMSTKFTPAEGAGALQIGTPNILSMAPLIGALEMINRVGIEKIRRRSLALNAHLRALVSERLTQFGFEIVTPENPERAGGHTAIFHPAAVQICSALRARGVVPDYRPPGIVRLAPAALYTRFEECEQAIDLMVEIMESGAYLSEASERGLVP
jgi:kynureninase